MVAKLTEGGRTLNPPTRGCLGARHKDGDGEGGPKFWRWRLEGVLA